MPEGMTIYEYVQGELEGYGLRQLEQLGFENTYAIGVPEGLAQEYGLETISDLIPVADPVSYTQLCMTSWIRASSSPARW